MPKLRTILMTLVPLGSALLDGSEHFYDHLHQQLAAAPTSADNGTGVLVKLEAAVAATGARCLDGSPGAYYIRKGVGSGAKKWYIHHNLRLLYLSVPSAIAFHLYGHMPVILIFLGVFHLFISSLVY